MPSESLNASTPASDAPRYEQLAYRPSEPTSLLELPNTYWAAQLIALPSRDLLEEYANEHGLNGASAARVAIRDSLFYALLLGIYETKELAEEAIADLPPPFDVDKPWLRSLESLQQAIIEGDEIAGDSVL
jgi:septal ring-binding cell division protein DamX